MSEAEAERRAQERREKDAARKRAERKAKGAKAHAESASRLKPWETFSGPAAHGTGAGSRLTAKLTQIRPSKIVRRNSCEAWS